MKEKIGVFVDYDQTLVDTASFYLANLDLFLKNLVYSLANFLRYAIKYRKLELLRFVYYFLLEEDKRSEEILERMKKRLNLYVKKNLFDLLIKLSENENYNVKIVSCSPGKIIRGVLEELEKIYGRKFDIDVIASSQNKLVTAKTKEKIARNYNAPKICFVDGPSDVEFSKNCDISIIKSSLAYYLSKEKPVGYRLGRKNFREVLKLLENKLTSS